MIFVRLPGRGHEPMFPLDRADLVDLFDTLLEVGHTVEETCDFMVAYAEGGVS